ncbi:MAG: hypothetical protein M1457_10185 [bacterium]|nr:hypothetical protein [bacterium]
MKPNQFTTRYIRVNYESIRTAGLRKIKIPIPVEIELTEHAIWHHVAVNDLWGSPSFYILMKYEKGGVTWDLFTGNTESHESIVGAMGWEVIVRDTRSDLDIYYWISAPFEHFIYSQTLEAGVYLSENQSLDDCIGSFSAFLKNYRESSRHSISHMTDIREVNQLESESYADASKSGPVDYGIAYIENVYKKNIIIAEMVCTADLEEWRSSRFDLDAWVNQISTELMGILEKKGFRNPNDEYDVEDRIRINSDSETSANPCDLSVFSYIQYFRSLGCVFFYAALEGFINILYTLLVKDGLDPSFDRHQLDLEQRVRLLPFVCDGFDHKIEKKLWDDLKKIREYRNFVFHAKVDGPAELHRVVYAGTIYNMTTREMKPKADKTIAEFFCLDQVLFDIDRKDLLKREMRNVSEIVQSVIGRIVGYMKPALRIRVQREILGDDSLPWIDSSRWRNPSR